jgi:hypothetical protein
MRWAELASHMKVFFIKLVFTAQVKSCVSEPCVDDGASFGDLLLLERSGWEGRVSLGLVGPVHAFKLILGLHLELWMVDQVRLDGLDDSLLFTVEHDSLDREESFIDTARVVHVCVRVEVLDEHISHPGVLIR